MKNEIKIKLEKIFMNSFLLLENNIIYQNGLKQK